MDKRSFLLLILFTVTIFLVHHWFGGDTKKPSTAVSIPSSAVIEEPAKGPSNEKLYVLENSYQQVVFSNIGGAVKELKLPFKSSENTKSVVLPVESDHIIKKNYPQNALFPLKEYYEASAKTLVTPHLGGYMPLLRRSLAKAPYREPFQLPPAYYAFNILADDDSLVDAVYTLKSFDKNKIVFELVQSQRKITKTYYFTEQASSTVPYTLMLDVQVDGDARGLSLSSGILETEIVSGSSASSIKYRYDRNQKPTIENAKLPKNTNVVKGMSPQWISNANSFFTVLINPLSAQNGGFETSFISGAHDPTRLTLIDANHNLYPADKYPGYLVALPLKPSSKPSTFRIFAGPLDQGILKTVDEAFRDPKTNASPYFMGAQSSGGWFSFISEPFSKFLFSVMKFFYAITHSWVAAIIFLTIVLKVILYPLNNWSLRSMTRLQMIAPEVQAIKNRFGKDPKRMNLEIMQLYKEKKANPFSSCLPMIIQMPFLVGMFDLLKSAFPLRGVSFIPGWIDNLLAPDTLFSWSYPIFFIGTEFHLLPILLGALMFLQQKSTGWINKHKPTTLDPEAKKQAAMTGNIMTIVFTLLFYNFPAGLNIYWISSTALGILQQLIVSAKLSAVETKTIKSVK